MSDSYCFLDKERVCISSCVAYREVTGKKFPYHCELVNLVPLVHKLLELIPTAMAEKRKV